MHTVLRAYATLREESILDMRRGMTTTNAGQPFGSLSRRFGSTSTLAIMAAGDTAAVGGC